MTIGSGHGPGHTSAWPEESEAPALPPKRYAEPSVFVPENLLREGRRQRGLAEIPVPRVAVLDPDGDLERYLRATGLGRPHHGWACYHTDMLVTDVGGIEIGVVGRAVGAPFAVLVAEQLAVSGAELVVSITSAGVIADGLETPSFVLIDKALRDEGTSGHYLAPATWSRLAPGLVERLTDAYSAVEERVLVGASWTTDAPYRETSTAVDAARETGVCCVEMEAAALYAYAAARDRNVVCLAHLTNTMATSGDDFEKGPDAGAPAALRVARATAVALLG